MEPEVITERLRELFKNSPKDNLEKLPKDTEEAIDNVVIERAIKFASYVSSNRPIEVVLAGAIGQAFFAGHEYAVRYGNLNAEMGVTDETLPSPDSK